MEIYLCGIDVGTTGVKVMILDLNGTSIGSGYREYPCIYPRQNWVEQDAEIVVQKTFEACKEAVTNSGVNPSKIKSIGLTTQRASVAFVDKNNNVIGGNFYTWQDNRALTEIEFIKSKMPLNEMYNIEGQPITPTFSFEKVIWLMRNDPEKYKLTKRIVFYPDYIMYRLGVDDIYTEVTNAGTSGMLDITNLVWSKKILDTYGIDADKLCHLVKPGRKVGIINKQIAEKTGFMEGTLICTGSGDNNCAALGVGMVKPGDAVLTLGTSGVLVVGVDKPVFEKNMGLMVNPAATEGLYEIEGIQLGAASSYKWIRDKLCGMEVKISEEVNVDAYEIMDYHIKKSPVGANGVMFMPFLFGTGYPYWNPETKGLFAGLSITSTKSDMIRAVMEGITLESKDMYETMKKSGIKINSMSITGGASKSGEWSQIISDMFNVSIKKLRVSDATIIGAAILGGVGAGIFKNTAEGVEKLVHVTETITPIKENVNIYNHMYKVYKNMYMAIDENNIFKQLYEL